MAARRLAPVVPGTPLFLCMFEEKVFLGHNIPRPMGSQYRCFTSPHSLKYDAICDDFGPLNIAKICSFIEIFDEEMIKYPDHKLVYLIEEGRRAFTNCTFLVGTYLILKRGQTPEDIWDRVKDLDTNSIELFRDASYSACTFGLTLLDCWQGFKRSCALGWIKQPLTPSTWGLIDIDEYIHYEAPRNADLVQIVPNKLIAFKGPIDFLDSRDRFRDDGGYREFSPEYYLDIFNHLKVAAVIRLNKAAYEPCVFTRNGIKHYDLEFADLPTKRLIDEFLRIIDDTDGMVAVHCRAGLGRTGLMIALYLMKSFEFTAREAIGWTRIMRTGSVIGEQQQFLCTFESSKSLRKNSATGMPTVCKKIGQGHAFNARNNEETRKSSLTTRPERCSVSPTMQRGSTSQLSDAQADHRQLPSGGSNRSLTRRRSEALQVFDQCNYQHAKDRIGFKIMSSEGNKVL